jgi:hypothetical protein
MESLPHKFLPTHHLKPNPSGAPVPHSCNLSYSEGRDQEDHGLKPAQVNSSQDPISKNTFTKKDCGVAQHEALSSNPSTAKNKIS